MDNFLNYDKQVEIIQRFEDQHYWNEVSIIDSIGFRVKEHLNSIFVGGIQTYKRATRFNSHKFGDFFEDGGDIWRSIFARFISTGRDKSPDQVFMCHRAR